MGHDAMKISAAIILLILAMNCYADAMFHVSLSSDQVTNSSNLGIIEVDGVGKVGLIAGREGNRLVVYASGPNGKIIGKAETVVGLKETPIYVSSSEGLKRITIYWGTK